MDDQEIERIIRGYLPQIIHMSLGTVGVDGKPWVCDVHYAYDDDLNLYWVSEQSSHHSQDIAANPRVAGTIVTQHHMDQFVRGLTFEGIVEVLQDITPNHPAYKAYVGRFAARQKAVDDAYAVPTTDGRRIYKVVVSDWYVNDGYKAGKIEKYRLER